MSNYCLYPRVSASLHPCSVCSWFLVLSRPKANVIFASFSSRRLKVTEVSGKLGAGVRQLVSTSLALQLCHSETGPLPASPLDFKPGSCATADLPRIHAEFSAHYLSFDSIVLKIRNILHIFFFQFSIFFYAKLGQSRARGDRAYHSFLTTASWWPSCGDTRCSTRRPERVSEIPTHHSVIWASPKISCPRKACREKRKTHFRGCSSFALPSVRAKGRGVTFRSVTHGRYEVGGGGGHSGPGGGRGVPERLGEEGPHHSIAGKEQPATQQPQRNMELKNIRNTHIYTNI